MIEAFNSMAAELASSRRRLERAAVDLERKNQEVDGRRRYIETILERVATGVVSIDPAGRIGTVNPAAMRLLEVDGDERRAPGGRRVRRAAICSRSTACSIRRRAPSADAFAQEVAVVREGRELHVAAAVTRLTGADGDYEGSVLVLDDVTPLIRAQKVAAWREVARRLAHEIKNPLTPIQLSAERMRRKLVDARRAADRSRAGVHDDDHRRSGIAQESRRRVLAVRAHAGAARRARPICTSCWTTPSRSTTACSPTSASSAASPTRCRRCASIPSRCGASSSTWSTTPSRRRDRRGTDRASRPRTIPSNSLVRIIVADDGPGIPAEEREKLFLPYYSTKGRGSGLGLAIVRRIVAEHGGSIEVADNVPRGTRFTIELPA